MNRGVLLAVVVTVALVGGGVLVVGDSVPGATPDSAADGEPTATTVAESPATTESSGASGGSGTGGSNADENTTTAETTTSTAGPGYDFTIESIEKCGSTCRDVTARLANADSETRRNVRVTTKVYADGDLLWSGNETVGSLAGGESHISTKRVNVGFAGGMAIKANDGYVTIVTIIESDSGTTRFSDRRKVA